MSALASTTDELSAASHTHLTGSAGTATQIAVQQRATALAEVQAALFGQVAHAH